MAHHSPAIPPWPLAELAVRARAGSADALGELYVRTGASLLSLARRLTGSLQDAEDVVHDVFLGLPEALRHYDERGRLEPWLRRVTARVALIRLRAHRRRREVDVPLRSASPSDAPSGIDDRLALAQAVDALPDALRTVLVLKLIEGYSHAEIAALLDITPRASEQRLHRAVQALRIRFAPAHEAP